MDLRERLAVIGPKRILSLDGGGFRSVIMLGFLEQIEQILRNRHQKPDLKLSDYFDLIGGTGAGAIIGAALAVGMDVARIKTIYPKIAKRIYCQRPWWRFWDLLYKHGPLEQELKKVFGDVALGSPYIKTGLCIITKRADVNRLQLFTNHPKDADFSKYAGVMVRRILRAGTGSRKPLLPEFLDLGLKTTEPYWFADAELSTINNPALLMVMTATLQGYPFRWALGENHLMLVSVGTGCWNPPIESDPIALKKKIARTWKEQLPYRLIDEANRYNQMTLQYMSRSETPWELDRQAGNLMLDLLTPEPVLTYLRYDVQLESEPLQKLGVSDTEQVLKTIYQMKIPKTLDMLIPIGETAGKQMVHESHFPKCFDVTSSFSITA